MVKVTFTLDDEAVRRLRETAERLRKPQSLVVREAVAEYAAAARRLSEVELRAMLDTFDRVVRRVPSRPAREVDTELRALRAARRRGGRRHPSNWWCIWTRRCWSMR
jgi:predicted transcriptional regulator